MTGAPLHDADGQLVGAVLVSRDVTEHRRLEEELATKAQEIESIFDTDADAVMLFDTEGNTIRMNAAQRRLLGYDVTGQVGYVSPEERARGYDVSDAEGQPLPQEEWPMYRVLRGEMLAGQHPVEIRMRTLDGRQVQVSVSGGPVVNGEGQIIGGVTSVRDVTAGRQLEQQRADILRVVAHDLASPRRCAQDVSAIAAAQSGSRTVTSTSTRADSDPDALDCTYAALACRHAGGGWSGGARVIP